MIARARVATALALLPLCTLQACASARSAPKPTTPAPQQVSAAQARELPERSELPLVVRETLNSSMARHGEELTFLLGSVVLLDYAGTEEVARQIAREPKLGRPRPNEKDTLNAMLPDAFFAHQDQLAERATALSVAAHEKDDAKLVKAFGALAETCVACHSSYLHEELDDFETAEQ